MKTNPWSEKAQQMLVSFDITICQIEIGNVALSSLG